MTNVTRTSTGEVWCWSDLHVGHAKLAENWRLWAGGNVPDHNETLRTLWNDRVRPNDEVWIVGDACMGNLVDSLEFIGTFHGTKLLFPGNHDRISQYYIEKHDVSPMKASRFWEQYAEVFTIMPETFITDGLVFNHFPWKGTPDKNQRDAIDALAPNMADYDEGIILVHGHTHKSNQFGERSVHVGVDAWPDGPITMDQVREEAEFVRAAA